MAADKLPRHRKPLSPLSRRRWHEHVSGWEMDPPALVLLENGLHALDRAHECRVVVDAEGATVKNRFGEVRDHPCVAQEQRWIEIARKHFSDLHLDAEPVLKPGRPLKGGQRAD